MYPPRMPGPPWFPELDLVHRACDEGMVVLVTTPFGMRLSRACLNLDAWPWLRAWHVPGTCRHVPPDAAPGRVRALQVAGLTAGFEGEVQRIVAARAVLADDAAQRDAELAQLDGAAAAAAAAGVAAEDGQRQFEGHVRPFPLPCPALQSAVCDSGRW